MLITVTPPDKAIDHFRRGGFVALLDSANREDEADLLQAAEYVSGESINFMLSYVRGLITVATVPQRLNELQIPVLAPQFGVENMPRCTMPVDYTPAVTTGVSAFDRAATIQALAAPHTRPEDFAGPVMSSRYRHVTEVWQSVLDTLRALCKIMAPDGHMAAGATLQHFLKAHNVPLVTVEQIAQALGVMPTPSDG